MPDSVNQDTRAPLKLDWTKPVAECVVVDCPNAAESDSNFCRGCYPWRGVTDA